MRKETKELFDEVENRLKEEGKKATMAPLFIGAIDILVGRLHDLEAKFERSDIKVMLIDSKQLVTPKLSWTPRKVAGIGQTEWYDENAILVAIEEN